MTGRITKSFNINLENNTFEQYESLLSNFRDWNSYKREIKLNSLLYDKKIEFKVDISSHTIGSLYVNILVDGDNDFDLLKKASCSIESMKFLIKGKEVIDLEITVKTLTTEWGKVIKDLFEKNIDLELNQYFSENQVKSFYFEYPRMSA